MKTFKSVVFDFPLCRKQVGEFEALLSSKDELSERGDNYPVEMERIEHPEVRPCQQPS
jgi:hypothetical protein